MVTQETIGSTEPERGCMGAGLRLPHQHGHCTARAPSPQQSSSAPRMQTSSHMYTICRSTDTADDETAADVPPASLSCPTLEQRGSDELSAQAGMKESLCPRALALDVVVWTAIQCRQQ